MRSNPWLSSLIVLGIWGCERISVGDLGGDAGSPDAPVDATMTSTDAPAADALSELADPFRDVTITGNDATTTGNDVTTGSDVMTTGNDVTTTGNDVNQRIDGPADGGEICPRDFKSYLPLETPANCPASVPSELRMPCDLPDNSICVYQNHGGFASCGCYSVLVGKIWKCWSVNNAALECPLSPPTEGSSCTTSLHCAFPLLQCDCRSGAWSCEPDSFFAQREVQRACPPTGIDESRVVKDLTEAEVQTWCGWYGDPSGSPRPPVDPNFPDETARYGYTSMNDLWGGGLEGCFAELPIEYCIRNMRFQPCDATLKELDDCLETMRGLGHGAIVGLGCAPFMRNANCDRTIVQKGPSAFGCRVPLK